jgi:hypothetical protein
MRHEAALSPDEVRHTERVRSFIADEIAKAAGWISF